MQCNPPNNFCRLSFDKTDHTIQNSTMVIRRYPPSNLISVIWCYFEWIKAKKWILFAEASDRESKKLVHNSTQKKHKKKSIECKETIYIALTLTNCSEGYKINKPLSGLLVYWRIMPLAERSYQGPKGVYLLTIIISKAWARNMSNQ